MTTECRFCIRDSTECRKPSDAGRWLAAYTRWFWGHDHAVHVVNAFYGSLGMHVCGDHGDPKPIRAIAVCDIAVGPVGTPREGVTS